MSIPLEMLSHPQLLSNEQLITVIQERHLRISNLNNMTRDDLLEVFHSYCVPYGQRKFKEKGRGKLINKTQQIIPGPSRVNTSNNTMSFTICNNNQNSRSIHHDNDRLKPPHDTLAGHTKRIKIATLAVPISDNSLKRKITFGSEIPATDSPPQKKERKPITWP